jgi:polyribonucleotide nucleotidyltransferase
MEPKFKINDFVKHTETGKVYKVNEVKIEKYQVFYKLKTDEYIMI